MLFTINRYTENRMIVGTTNSGPIPLPTLEVIMAVDKAINEQHVCLLLSNNHEMVISTALYNTIKNEHEIPYAWRRPSGIIVGSFDKAERVIVELEKLKMWAILKQ